MGILSDAWDWITGTAGKAKDYSDLAKVGVAALSTYASYKDQKAKNELQQAAYDDYMKAAQAAGKEAEAAIALNLTPMTVSGTPTTKAQVTDYTAATGLKHGGISSLRKGYARGPDEFEVEQMDEEEIITPDYLMKEEGVNIGPQVFYNTGRGDRANALMIWDQMSTPDKSIFDFDFEIFFQDGGWRDMIRGEAPNVQENMKMASHEGNDAFLEKRYQELLEMNLSPAEAAAQAEKELSSGNVPGPMATGGIAGLRKGYARGPEEFEVEQMDEEIVTPFDLKNEEGVPIGPMAGPDWYIKRIEHLEFLGYDYEEASDIAFDDDKYYSIVGMESAIPRGPVNPERPPIYLPKPGEEPQGIQMAAYGGRIGYGSGTGIRDYARSMNNGNGPITRKDYIDIYLFLGYDSPVATSLGTKHYKTGVGQDHNTSSFAHGGRTGYAMGPGPVMDNTEGGIMDLGGLEKDYRFSGGFVPIGEYEKKDDVPARLSKNEFVFTADAVRAAGGGSINKGAKRMYETMKNLEAQPTAKRMIA